MKIYDFDVTRNGVTLRIKIESDNYVEAKIQLDKFLKENKQSFKYLDIYITYLGCNIIE